MSLYLSWIEGSPPKRNAPGSSPGKDATNNAESLYFQGFSAFLFFTLFPFVFLLVNLHRKLKLQKRRKVLLIILSKKNAVLLRKYTPLLICPSDTAKNLANLNGGSYAVMPIITELSFSAFVSNSRYKLIAKLLNE